MSKMVLNPFCDKTLHISYFVCTVHRQTHTHTHTLTNITHIHHSLLEISNPLMLYSHIFQTFRFFFLPIPLAFTWLTTDNPQKQNVCSYICCLMYVLINCMIFSTHAQIKAFSPCTKLLIWHSTPSSLISSI